MDPGFSMSRRALPRIVQRSRKISQEALPPAAIVTSLELNSSDSLNDKSVDHEDIRITSGDVSESSRSVRYSSFTGLGSHRNSRWMGKDFKSGVVAFNLKPKDGIEFFKTHGVIDAGVESVAELLCFAPGLSRKRIGEYIGRIQPFNTQVLECYLGLMDIRGTSIDDALRVVLACFRLPGEAQCIDIIVNKFGGVYCAQNPGVFAHDDVAYVLSFSLIMLNTDLHSPNIPAAKKMTLPQWRANNRGINQGENLPQELLDNLYAGIKRSKIDMSEGDLYESDVVTFMAPEMRGWLMKKGEGVIQSWHKWWFVLTDGCLYYFKGPKDSSPRCIIALENCTATPLGKKRAFEISSIDGAVIKSVKREGGKLIQGKHRSFILQAGTDELRVGWIEKLTMGLQEVKHPV